MPITNIQDEREIVKRGLAEGKSPEFIKSAVLRYRQTVAPQQNPSTPYSQFNTGIAPTPTEGDRNIPIENGKPLSEIRDRMSDVATGVAKGFVQGALGTAQLAIQANRGIRALVNPKKTYGELREQDIKKTPEALQSLYSGTPKALELEALLKSKNKWETSGKILEFVGELALGTGAKSIQKALQGSQKALETATLRLTGAQLRKVGTEAISDASETMVKYGANVGTAEHRAAKFADIYDSFELNLQKAFEEAGPGFSVPKKKLVSQLELLKGKFQGRSSEFAAVKKQIDRAINNLKISFAGDTIPGAALNNLKRDVMRSQSYSKAGLEVIDDVSFAIGNTMYDALKEAGTRSGLKIGTATFEQFNKEYSRVIMAKNLLEQAIGRPELGILTRIASTIVGGSGGKAIAGTPGAATGIVLSQGVAKALLGTPAKSALSGLLGVVRKGGERAVNSLNVAVPGLGTAISNIALPAKAAQTVQTVKNFLNPNGTKR